MAISRLTQTTLQNGFEKYNQVWDGRSAVGSMEPISAITLSAAQSSIEFNTIPGTYSHLQIRGIYSGSIAERSLMLRFNSDAGTNYSWHEIGGNGTAVSPSSGTNATVMYVGYAGNTTNNLYPSPVIIDILDYAHTNKYKTIRSLQGNDINGSGWAILDSGNWRSTSAVTSIVLLLNSGNFQQYSSFTLYGIK